MDSIDMGLELVKLFNFTDGLKFVFIKLVVKKRITFNCLVSNNKIWCIVDNVYWIHYNFDRLTDLPSETQESYLTHEVNFFFKDDKKIEPCMRLKWHTIKIYFPRFS